jgi:hypothetical protein
MTTARLIELEHADDVLATIETTHETLRSKFADNEPRGRAGAREGTPRGKGRRDTAHRCQFV